MSKIIFVLHRRPELSREACLEQWNGEAHTSIVRSIGGLARAVQNHVISAPGEPVCDGVGELWFESDAAMEKALGSPEFAAAVDDAGNFLDMERTGMVVVEERPVLG